MNKNNALICKDVYISVSSKIKLGVSCLAFSRHENWKEKGIVTSESGLMVNWPFSNPFDNSYPIICPVLGSNWFNLVSFQLVKSFNCILYFFHVYWNNIVILNSSSYIWSEVNTTSIPLSIQNQQKTAKPADKKTLFSRTRGQENISMFKITLGP